LAILLKEKKIALIVINYNKILFTIFNNINTSIKNNLSFVNLIEIYLVALTTIKMYLASIKTNFRISNYRKIDFVFSLQLLLFISNYCSFIKLIESHY